MSSLLFLIPLSLLMGLVGLGAFLWSLRSGQYDDLKGAALRILVAEDVPDDATPRRAADSSGSGGRAGPRQA